MQPIFTDPPVRSGTQRQAMRQLFLIRPDVVFLNHGSFGACPKAVFDTYQRWQLELERQPVEFLGRRFEDLMLAAREALAAYVGAEPDELVYVPNATVGLNTVARSLPLQPGDEVLASDHEYGALDRTWRFICSRRGAHYVNQPLRLPVQSAEQVVEALWAGVTPRTRVLFLSHITSSTALILPVAELIRRAREANILTVIDGAHAPGQIPLDLHALGADFYAGNCHKWLCAPKGSAFLYARREVQHVLEPLVVSWGWNREQTCEVSKTSQVSSRFIDEQQWQGTRDIAAYLSVPAAIQFQAEHDWPRVRQDCHQVLREALRRIGELTGLPGIWREQDLTGRHTWFAQMAAFPLPECDAESLQRRLLGAYQIEVPVFEWSGRQFVRVSIQGYNTEADVNSLVRGLTALLN